jgi:hypothetical protein
MFRWLRNKIFIRTMKFFAAQLDMTWGFPQYCSLYYYVPLPAE